MRRLIGLLVFLPSFASAQQVVAPSATSQCFDVFVSDSSVTTGAGKTGLAYNTSSIACSYREKGASATQYTGSTAPAAAITLASSTLGTYTSGAFKEISSSLMPGWYEFCPPDAALSPLTAGDSGTYTDFQCSGASNMAPMNLRVSIGFPAGSLPYNVVAARGTAQTDGAATSSRIKIAASDTNSDNYLTGFKIMLLSGTAAPSWSCVTGNTNSTKIVTVSPAFNATPDNTTTYDIVADAGCRANIKYWNDNVVTGSAPSGTGGGRKGQN